MADQDRAAFTRAAWVNVAGNLLKIVVEGGIGLAFGSLALLADATHSLADLLASAVVLVWGRASFRGPDADHPHGHERIEPLTALFVGATLVGLAVLLLYEAVQSVLVGPRVRFSVALVGGLIAAIGLMGSVYWYTTRVNDALNSPALHALAADCRNDIYTSLAAGVGVVGIALGAPVLDPVAGAVVSLLVLWQGIAIARENVAYLVGTAPAPEQRAKIRDRITAHPEVEGVHDLQIYFIGPQLEVEFHAEVRGDLNLHEAHAVETDLIDSLRSLGNVGDVHVHLDPAGIGEWEDATEE